MHNLSNQFCKSIYFQHIQLFSNLLEKNKLPRFILFEGKPSTDKSQLMLDLASMISTYDHKSNIKNNPTTSSIIENHPDIWIAPKDQSHLFVTIADEIQLHLNYSPMRSLYRVVIVNDIDRFNISCMNKLLLVLESPPDYALILCSTSRKQLVLPTVLSRAILWPLGIINYHDFNRLVGSNDLSSYSKDDQNQIDDFLSKININDTRYLYNITHGCVYSAKEIKFNFKMIAKLYNLLEHDDFVIGFRLAKEFINEYKITCRNLLFYIELSINIYYRQQRKHGIRDFNSKKLQNRRSILKDLHHRLKSSDVSLNNTLIIQSLIAVSA